MADKMCSSRFKVMRVIRNALPSSIDVTKFFTRLGRIRGKDLLDTSGSG